MDATNTVAGLWNAGPSVVPAFRSNPGHDGDANPLDGFAVRGFPGLICSEQAFHYLLEIERRRSASTRAQFLLLLIECQAAETRLFPIVCNAVRETDFVGWYRQGAVIGAALTQDGRTGTTRAGEIVRDRIGKALHRGLPRDLASRVRLHLYEVLGDDELRID
jgi:hypothetical protein